MGAIDMFIINHENIIKGFNELLGKKSYIIVRDKEKNFVCMTYDIDGCSALVNKYLLENDFDVQNLEIKKETINKRDLRFPEIQQYKLVVLDNELALYKDVVAKATNYIIEGYDGKEIPKYGINKFFTISKKEYSN